MLLSAAVGLAVGFLAALGWRFAVPRVYVDAAPPPTDGSPADTAYFRVFDYLRYVDGPSWWPSAALLPVVGVAVGVLAGLLTRAAAGQRRRPGGVAVALAVTGLLAGVAGALYAGQWTPQIKVVGVSDPSYAASPPSLVRRSTTLWSGHHRGGNWGHLRCSFHRWALPSDRPAGR